jgi:hypothetical protein
VPTPAPPDRLRRGYAAALCQSSCFGEQVALPEAAGGHGSRLPLAASPQHKANQGGGIPSRVLSLVMRVKVAQPGRAADPPLLCSGGHTLTGGAIGQVHNRIRARRRLWPKVWDREWLKRALNSSASSAAAPRPSGWGAARTAGNGTPW